MAVQLKDCPKWTNTELRALLITEAGFALWEKVAAAHAVGERQALNTYARSVLGVPNGKPRLRSLRMRSKRNEPKVTVRPMNAFDHFLFGKPNKVERACLHGMPAHLLPSYMKHRADGGRV